MEALDIGRDLLIVLVAAIAGGMLARALRLPVILGYIAAGIAVGPFGLGTLPFFGGAGFVSQSETISSLAEIGVILLLFAIGLEFSLKELLGMGKIAVLGGAFQIVLTAAAGYMLGHLLGLDTTGAIFFGFIISLSSTMVVLKLLVERGEMDTNHGRILLGILLVQDLAVVPIMVTMQAVTGATGSLWTALGLAIGKAWERYKLQDGRWIDRRRGRESRRHVRHAAGHKRRVPRRSGEDRVTRSQQPQRAPLATGLRREHLERRLRHGLAARHATGKHAEVAELADARLLGRLEDERRERSVVRGRQLDGLAARFGECRRKVGWGRRKRFSGMCFKYAAPI